MGLMFRRGEVWWVRLDPTLGSEIAKTRPCVIVSTNAVNEWRRTIVVVPLSSSPRASPPLLVQVQCSGRNAIAVVDQIRAVSKDRIEKCMGQLSPEDLSSIEQALRDILELE